MRARLVTLADWERSGRRIRWKQHEIFVREGGAGPSVLLIHGFPTSSWDWHSLWSPSLAGVGHYPQLEAPRQVLEALRERVRGLILPG